MIRSTPARLLASVVLLVAGVALTQVTAQASAVVSMAEQPGAAPNYLFPLAPCQYDSANNVEQFQDLLFRPVYWFGLGGSGALQPSLSMANAPVANKYRTAFTVTLKGWRFANGQVVTGTNLAFYANLLRSNEAAVCSAAGGQSLADLVHSLVVKKSAVTFNFGQPMNPAFVQDNLFSQLLAFPTSWDVTSSGANAGCATATYGSSDAQSRCAAVLANLQSRGAATSGFASGFWRAGVTGPWTLSSFIRGAATFSPNPAYGGSPRASVTFREVPESSTTSVENDLVNHKVTFALLPNGVVGASGTWSALGATYQISPLHPWAISPLVVNWSSVNGTPLLAQSYLRQALQRATDQTALLKAANESGRTLLSAVPSTTPASVATWSSVNAANVAAATTLLTSHGWSKLNGVYTCSSPGSAATSCGDGIAGGTPLQLNLDWSGTSNGPLVAALRAQWNQFGVALTTTQVPASTLATCPATAQLCYAGPWYLPGQYFPALTDLLGTNGLFNTGGYGDAGLDQTLSDALHTVTTATNYATTTSITLPTLYLPVADRYVEVRATARHSKPPFNLYGVLMPEVFTTG